MLLPPVRTLKSGHRLCPGCSVFFFLFYGPFRVLAENFSDKPPLFVSSVIQLLQARWRWKGSSQRPLFTN